MIRGPVRKVLDIFLTESGIRLFFVHTTLWWYAFHFLFWTPMPLHVWDVQESLSIAIYGVIYVCIDIDSGVEPQSLLLQDHS